MDQLEKPIVRAAGHEDIAGIVRVLGNAFARDDPIDEYIFPDEAVRLSRAPRMMRVMLEHRFLLAGGAAVATLGGEIAGALLWYPADYRKRLWHELISGPKFLAAMGVGAVRRAMDVDAAIARVAPAQPHVFGVYLGADPVVQRRGLGRALLKSLTDRADAEGVRFYLLCKDGNVDYYRGIDFEVVGVTALSAGGPQVNVMVRPPASS